MAICRLAAAIVYGKVRAALGIQRAAISGGGSLAPHLDDFYESVSIFLSVTLSVNSTHAHLRIFDLCFTYTLHPSDGIMG